MRGNRTGEANSVQEVLFSLLLREVECGSVVAVINENITLIERVVMKSAP